jgi:hypothetical protein
MIKRLLRAELRVWHLLLVVVLVLGSGTGVMGAPATGNAPSPAALDAYWAAGQVRMATVSSTTAVYVKSTDGWKAVLAITLTVPSGQKADIAAFFNGEGYKYANGYCYARFELENGTVLKPDESEHNGQWVVDGYIFKNAYPTISDQGFMLAVPPGTHSVTVKMMATGGDCYVADRSLIVIANQHA